MTAGTFKDIEKLEDDLWEAADKLRANSKLTSGDYITPKRPVRPEDHVARRSLYLLPSRSRFDHRSSRA